MRQYTAMRKANRNFWGRWYQMNMRCINNEPAYEDVSVCAEWHIELSGEQGFLNFAEDMMEDFDEDLTLDRIDPRGQYDAHNCRWVSRTVQNRNTRFHKHTERGQALTKMYEKWGHNKAVKQRFWSRHKRGWSFDDIVNVPPDQSNRYSKIRHQKPKKSTKSKYFGKILGWFKPKSSV
ncbi:MAG: hypothetical protein CBC91_07530 [Rickettsiales bacterium TMED131]|nr:MAG: hypothetical protein CBC91_07530 [Rickettsiales bacterium TMED131]